MSYNDDNYNRDAYGTSKKSSKTSTEAAADTVEDPAAKDNCPCDASGQPIPGQQQPKKKGAKGAAVEAATGEEGAAPAAEEGAQDASISVGEDVKKAD